MMMKNWPDMIAYSEAQRQTQLGEFLAHTLTATQRTYMTKKVIQPHGQSNLPCLLPTVAKATPPS